MLIVADHTKLWMCQRYKYFEIYQKKGRKSFQDKLYKHLSMILDGMGQKKTSIPYCFQKTKALADLVPYKTAVIGVIVHGFEARAYLVEPFWKHDSDLAIEIICRTLQRILEAGHPLAPVLYLQMDNCWRENKNQHVLTFLALLLKLRLFRKIKLNFDLVGHTHEDIDQLFRANAPTIVQEPAPSRAHKSTSNNHKVIHKEHKCQRDICMGRTSRAMSTVDNLTVIAVNCIPVQRTANPLQPALPTPSKPHR